MDCQILFLLAVVRLTLGAIPDYHGTDLTHYHDDYYDTEPSYNFKYEVADEYGNNHGHEEVRDGYDTKGSYYVLLPDGRKQVVTYYVSGDSGFVAEVTYEGEPHYDNHGPHLPLGPQGIKPFVGHRGPGLHGPHGSHGPHGPHDPHGLKHHRGPLLHGLKQHGVGHPGHGLRGSKVHGGLHNILGSHGHRNGLHGPRHHAVGPYDGPYDSPYDGPYDGAHGVRPFGLKHPKTPLHVQPKHFGGHHNEGPYGIDHRPLNVDGRRGPGRFNHGGLERSDSFYH